MKRALDIIRRILEVVGRSALTIFYPQKLHAWFVVIIASLLAWSFMHLQINVYIFRTEYWSLLILSGIFCLFYSALEVLKAKVDRQLLLIFVLHSFAILSYLVILPGTNTMLKLSATSLLYWLFGFTIVRSSLYMQSFLNFNFVLLTCLIFLNTVPILYWLGIVNLDFYFVNRVSGELGIGHLDPIYFGIFGATESSVNEAYYISTARLQGWSSEPLHWGYFVFLSFSITLLLMSMTKGIRKNLVLGGLLLYTLIYSYFLHSSSVNISILAAITVMVVYRLLCRNIANDSQRAFLLLTLAVIGPGFVVPFILSSIPGIELFFIEEEVLGEGSNWQNKIDWLSANNLYGRFLPQFSENLVASHNAILAYYLNMGYLLTLPLMLFFYILFLITVRADNLYLCMATIVFVVAHTILIDSSFIYPSFVLWLLLVYYVSRKLSDNKVKQLQLDHKYEDSDDNLLQTV